MSSLKPKLLIIIHCFYVVSCLSNDICGLNNRKRFYLEYNESGSLTANQQYNVMDHRSKNGSTFVRCTVEFITCPSCIIEIHFR